MTSEIKIERIGCRHPYGQCGYPYCDCFMPEIKIELRQNGRFTVREVEALLGQLSQAEREFGEE